MDQGPSAPGKQEFLAVLAHELRTPLAPIMNAVALLHLDEAISPESKLALGMIDRQMKQLVQLVDDLLDTARISQGQIELVIERIDLASALETALETSRPLIEERGQMLTVTTPSQRVHVNADRVRLGQAFANLLRNAAKYTPRGGRISLDVACRKDAAIVTVTDDGRGIPAELLPHVFDLFRPGPQAELRNGLSVGLALVKELIDLHGGSIGAASLGVGKGSQFAVHLPVAALR